MNFFNILFIFDTIFHQLTGSASTNPVIITKQWRLPPSGGDWIAGERLQNCQIRTLIKSSTLIQKHF